MNTITDLIKAFMILVNAGGISDHQQSNEEGCGNTDHR